MAEYGWGLSEELIKKACTELNEIPEQRWEASMAVKEQMVTRPDITDHCRERHYSFQIRRCHDEGCCPTPEREWAWLPDPILDITGQHYKPFDELLGKETTDKDRPSSLKQTVAAVAQEQQGCKNSILVGQNVRQTVNCCECQKPRCIYAKTKLTARDQRALTHTLEKYDYTCGSVITPDDFLRQDDAFILRFLRARKFDTLEAFKLYASYFVYRQNNPNLFKDFKASESAIKEALYDGIPGVLEKCDHFGRRIIVLYSANWDNCRYGLSAIYRAILLTLEKLIDSEECQINGFVIIVDWSQFTFRQSTWLNPKVLKLMIEGLQDCFPARFGAVHFVNQPWYIEAMFKMIKPFLKEKNRNKIHFHGINLGTLHNFIHKEVLPAELGGTEPPYNNQYWAKELIGDESFSFSDKHIYWPENCMTQTNGHSTLKTRSESFPLDHFTAVEEHATVDEIGTYLDEEFFLID